MFVGRIPSAKTYCGREQTSFQLKKSRKDAWVGRPCIEFMISIVSFYGLPLKYVLLALLIVVGISLLILVIAFTIHLCRFWRRIRRGRLSRRHLRQLVLKRFKKDNNLFDCFQNPITGVCDPITRMIFKNSI
ncbi:unnamed protein product [Schistosoma curassoni]|uniref:Uncharacterized protein n=1 Tax=Schistosoma curassoni TaxID=6186 RepID=A0A183JPJ6_9TREM|nr:unnamed protein product [Schistosoma curassoni]